tara:strand:- start:88 stop:774 length:687 start_codon:yes stop_codon:yes gene_type:complete
MRFHKRLLKSSFFIKFLAHVASAYIRLVYYTSRWSHVNRDIPEHYWNRNKPFICVFWHNRVLMNVYGWNRKKPFNMLISKHSDGKFIAQIMDNFHIKTVEGSKSKGGLDALRNLLKVLKKGESIGITPDGPRGPRFEVSDGVMKLAQLSGCDILPGAYGVKRRKILGSWDRFILALPFTKGYFVWGDALSVPSKTTPKEMKILKENLQNNLRETSNKADALCGHEPLT